MFAVTASFGLWSFLWLCYFYFCLRSPFSGRISGLEEQVKELKSSLSKVQSEKKQLQEKLNDLEKVGFHF